LQADGLFCRKSVVSAVGEGWLGRNPKSSAAADAKLEIPGPHGQEPISSPMSPHKAILSSVHALAICRYRGQPLYSSHHQTDKAIRWHTTEEDTMKIWMKPSVREQEVGLEVTSYLPAEIDII
jgi:coenzyme PQQ precursor peptide PqqA